MYNDLPAGAWLGANFYTAGIPTHIGWSIVGVRIWIPLDYSGSALGSSGYIGLQKVDAAYEGLVIGQPGAPSHQQIIDGFNNNGSKTAFTGLHTGWNDVYFSQEWPLDHGNGFAVGYQIGDGRYYSYTSAIGGASRQASDGTNLYLSEANASEGAAKRSEFGVPGLGADWSLDHYGIDVVIREPILPPDGEVSVFNKSVIGGGSYQVNSDLEGAGWTTSHFYVQPSEEDPTGDWTLVGARIWLPDASHDPAGLVGVTATCGYYVKNANVVGEPDDTPNSVITNVSSSPHASTSLVRGWNVVHFDTPVVIPAGAGVAIGWKIGDGSYYVSGRRGDAPIQSEYEPQLYLAGSLIASERRGVFTVPTTASWSYQDYHYGGDILIKKAV
jgi:hypothetical protein